MNRHVPTLAILTAVLALGACVSPSDRLTRAEIAPRQTGIEGRWAAVGGPVAYTATFSGGSFSSTEDATGAPLATGNYRNVGPSQITINSRSNTSGQESAINCSQMAADRMACVTAGGTRFELTRRA
ncbi:hypothetical protein [Aureimonas populi]|uniref:Outer membrane lipoprotein n=1 Tax=Aureimonas populi TaxID=1701758 RepID=A0ABW5CG26_9HYPH|nr:hypothetical protein [Aureimonas populi]